MLGFVFPFSGLAVAKRFLSSPADFACVHFSVGEHPSAVSHVGMRGKDLKSRMIKESV